MHLILVPGLRLLRCCCCGLQLACNMQRTEKEKLSRVLTWRWLNNKIRAADNANYASEVEA
jgi:hypothetical protein